MADTVINVSTSAELYAALAQATGGETIVLAAGDYGELDLSSKSGFGVNYDAPVTMISADPENMASFSKVTLKGASNVTFDSIEFDYNFLAGDLAWHRVFDISNSHDITIANSVFDGDIATGLGTPEDGYGYGYALSISDSSNINVDNNEFLNWERAIVVNKSQNLEITRNDIHDIRSDGMDFAGVDTVLIEGNFIHDFTTAPETGDHADMIQFWTTVDSGTSENVTIRGNILDIGDGGITQSIFMRNGLVDSGQAGEEMFYKNFLIEENIILNGHTHGITVGEIDGLVIANNSVLSIDDPDLVPAIAVASASVNVQITQNATSMLNGYSGQASWTVTNNALVQNRDPNAPNHYTSVFVESSMFSESGVAGFLVEAGSVLDDLRAGASTLFTDLPSDGTTLAFDVASNPDGSGSTIFDAAYLFGHNSAIPLDGGQYFWDFGDGTTAQGQVVSHLFSIAGMHEVTLTVQTPDGRNTTAQSVVAIAGDHLLAFDPEDGHFHLSGYGQEEILNSSNGASVSFGGGLQAIKLGGTGSQLSVPRELLGRFFGAESFDLSMTLQADSSGASGEVARLHMSFVISVGVDGSVSVTFWPAEGDPVTLTSVGVVVNDGSEHDIAIGLNGSTDTFELVVDGEQVSVATVTSAAPAMAHWDLTFGDPWGGQNFNGYVSAFDLNAANNDYPVYTGTPDLGWTEEPEPSVDETLIEPISNPSSVPDAGGEPAPEPDTGEPPTSPANGEPVIEETGLDTDEFAIETAGNLIVAATKINATQPSSVEEEISSPFPKQRNDLVNGLDLETPDVVVNEQVDQFIFVENFRIERGAEDTAFIPNLALEAVNGGLRHVWDSLGHGDGDADAADFQLDEVFAFCADQILQDDTFLMV